MKLHKSASLMVKNSSKSYKILLKENYMAKM